MATVYPHLTSRLLGERDVPVELVDVTGSVEVAPRLGLADAIVDLVSSGNTLRTNGLRSLGELFSSEAVLVAAEQPDDASLRLAPILASVVQAREARYLMLNAPESALEQICDLVPGSGAPSVIPLAQSGHGGRARARPGRRRLAPAPAAGGRRCELDPARPGREDVGVSDVATIVADVRERGDAALADWSLRFDGVEPARAVPSGDVPEEAILALADAVRRWHERQRPADIVAEILPGVVLERRWTPIASVGVYVPRRLVSTLVMCAVPAQVAGVGRVIVVTPAGGRRDRCTGGRASRYRRRLGRRRATGDRRARLRHRIDHGRRQDRRPGNAFVNEAKAIVSRDVAVDLPAGPSEVVVLASDGADLELAALELAAQQEHGADAVCRLVEANGDLDAALARVEELAPEHLVLLGEEAERLAPRVRNAGAIFVGRWSPVAAGDYATGGNHVLPTGGRARAVGGLGLEAFLKPVTVQRLTADGLAHVRPVVEALAELEGMPAHAEAVRR